jgi:mannosyltransferase OCH1-like enzyme
MKLRPALCDITLRQYAAAILRKAYRTVTPREKDISAFYMRVPRSSARIANDVYQTWKRPVLNSLHAYYVGRFRRLNPDYSFHFYDDERMDEYMRIRYADQPILDVYRRISVPASRADIWRYCILYREGGVYCDIDSVFRVPLRTMIADDMSELIAFEGIKWRDQLSLGDYTDPAVFLPGPPESVAADLALPDNLIINWALCFEKRNPILAETIDLIVRHFAFYRDREFQSIRRAVVLCTGPVALTQAVWQWMRNTGKRPNLLGVDYDAKGIFKLPVPYGNVYEQNTGVPHYSQFKNCAMTYPEPV